MSVNFRYLQAFEPFEVFNEVQFWLRIHRTKRQGAILGFQDGKRAAVTEPVPVPNLFGHYNLALLAHVNYGHVRRLLSARAYSKPFLPRGDCSGGGWTTPVITRSAFEPALAGERIFHPLARPPRRQRLFPSGQFVEFVSQPFGPLHPRLGGEFRVA